MPYLFLIQWNKGWKRKSLTQRVIVKWKKTHYVFEEKWWHMSFLFFDWPWEKKSSNSISPKKESLKFALHPREQYWGILLQLSGIYMPAVKPDYSPQVDTGLPGGASGKEAAAKAGDTRDAGSYPWVGKVSWRRSWQPTPVFLPGEAHGQRSPMGYSPQCSKESDVTEVNSTHSGYGNMSYQASSQQSCNVYQTTLPMKWKQFPKKMDGEEISQPREYVFRNQNVFKVNVKSSQYINATHYLAIKMIFQNLKLNCNIIFGWEEALVQNMTFQVRKIWVLMSWYMTMDKFDSLTEPVLSSTEWREKIPTS